MDEYDLGLWLITWMMLGLLGMPLVGGWYWTYISIVSAIIFVVYFNWMVFRKPKEKNER